MDYKIDSSELIKIVLAGNQKAFAWVVRRYQGMVLQVLNKRFSRELSEKLAQEVFVEAYRKLPNFALSDNFSEWLLVLTLQACHEYRTKNYNELSNSKLNSSEKTTLDSVMNGGGASDLAFSDSMSDLHEKVLRLLNPEEQLLVECNSYEKYSVKIIARVLKSNSLVIRFKSWIAKYKMHKMLANLLEAGNQGDYYNIREVFEI